MFMGKARSLPLIGAPENGFTMIGSSLSRKHLTTLKGLPGTNTLAYYEYEKITPLKGFTTLG
jgi:hypothetical protein